MSKLQEELFIAHLKKNTWGKLLNFFFGLHEIHFECNLLTMKQILIQRHGVFKAVSIKLYVQNINTITLMHVIVI